MFGFDKNLSNLTSLIDERNEHLKLRKKDIFEQLHQQSVILSGEKERPSTNYYQVLKHKLAK